MSWTSRTTTAAAAFVAHSNVCYAGPHMPAAPLLSHPNVLLALPFCPRGYRGHPSPPTAGRVPDMRSDIAARVLSPVASPFQAARTFHVDAAVLPNLFDALVEVPRVCCCSGSTSIHSSTTVLLVVVVVLVLVSHSVEGRPKSGLCLQTVLKLPKLLLRELLPRLFSSSTVLPCLVCDTLVRARTHTRV